MANPVTYNSADDAVRAASASISFEARSGSVEHTSRSVAVDGATSESEAKQTLASILRGLPDDRHSS